MSIIALANATVPVDVAARAAVAENGGQPGKPPAKVVTALEALVKFLPTETVTLFWLAIPAAKALGEWQGLKGGPPTLWDWIAGGLLWLLTPVLFLLAYLSAEATTNRPRPKLHEWPRWRPIATVIAFPVWAMAVPGNPFITDSRLLMAVWVVAALVSMLLALLDPIVEKWL